MTASSPSRRPISLKIPSKIAIPVLVIHAMTTRRCLIMIPALSAKLVQNGTLHTPQGRAPHGNTDYPCC